MRSIALLLLFPVAVAVGASLSGGCSSQKSSSAPRLGCDPGQFTVCTCKNGNPGVKLCNPDAKTFQPCMLGGKEECPGGELILDDAGNPIDDGGLPEGEDPSVCPG